MLEASSRWTVGDWLSRLWRAHLCWQWVNDGKLQRLKPQMSNREKLCWGTCSPGGQ